MSEREKKKPERLGRIRSPRVLKSMTRNLDFVFIMNEKLWVELEE